MLCYVCTSVAFARQSTFATSIDDDAWGRLVGWLCWLCWLCWLDGWMVGWLDGWLDACRRASLSRSLFATQLKINTQGYVIFASSVMPHGLPGPTHVG